MYVSQRVADDLRLEGVNPVISVECALEEHLFERFRDVLGDRLIKPPRVRLHAMYFKERYATLHRLKSTGYETWYPEIHFATSVGIEIGSLQIIPKNIDLVPVDYGFGVCRAHQMKVRPLRRQTNHEFRINHLRIPGSVFQSVIDQVAASHELPQPLVANFSPGPDIAGYHLTSFDHMLTGARLFCACAKRAHISMLSRAKELAPQYAKGSWPQSVIMILDDAVYADELCHLCIARSLSSAEAKRRYGQTIESAFASYLDQIAFDLGVDEATARAEARQILGLSRWVSESALYGIIRDLFPDYRVLREASPTWLGRMRLDIFVPDLNLAIEYQGEQHYRPVSVFGGEDAYQRVLERDALKRRLCQENGIDVIDVRYDAPTTKAAMRQRLQRFLR
jgi:hypothetical protein